jgi:hypothetical protein
MHLEQHGGRHAAGLRRAAVLRAGLPRRVPDSGELRPPPSRSAIRSPAARARGALVRRHRGGAWTRPPWRGQRSPSCYSTGASAAARANGLPSESRHTAHRLPGWTTEPPSARTRSSVVDRSETVKYGREAVSPGPRPRWWTPRRRLSVLVCHPDPAAAGRGVRATPRTPFQNRGRVRNRRPGIR